MAVFRVEKNRGYTVMSNHHLRNKDLSLKAKGLLSQMLSLPENWDYILSDDGTLQRAEARQEEPQAWNGIDGLLNEKPMMPEASPSERAAALMALAEKDGPRLGDGERRLIMEYAEAVGDNDKVMELINRLCEQGYEMQHGYMDDFMKSQMESEIAVARAEQTIAHDPAAEPIVTIIWSESPHLKDGQQTYEQKYFDLSSQIDQLQRQREDLQQSAETESTMKRRISEFRKTLEQNEVLDTFDRYVFESIVEKVIVGGYDEDGNKDPSMLTFIYKTGFKNSVDGSNFKPPRKNSKAAKQRAGLCSHTTDEAKATCSYHSDDTRGDDSTFVQTQYRAAYRGGVESGRTGFDSGGEQGYL